MGITKRSINTLSHFICRFLSILLSTVKAGNIFNVPLYVHWHHGALISLLALGAMPGMIEHYDIDYGILVIIVCIIIFEFSLVGHEFAHVYAGKRLGYNTDRVDLLFIGAVATMSSTGDRPLHQFIVAAAGPIFNVAIFLPVLIFVEIYGGPDLEGNAFAFILMWTAVINLLLCVANLIPVFPLDGGRILASICWFISKEYSVGIRLASGLSAFVAIPFSIGSFYYGAYVFGVILAALCVLNTAMAFVFDKEHIQSRKW